MTGTPVARLCIDGRFLLQDVTGVQRVAIELVRALDDLLTDGAFPGLRVELLTPPAPDPVTRLELRSVVLRRVGRLTAHAWEQLELPRYVGPDPLLCLGNLAPLTSLLGRSPVHTMVHDLSYAYFPAAYSRRFRLVYGTVIPVVLARSRRVFTVSTSEQHAILRRYGRLIDHERLVAVQNGGGEGADLARPSHDPQTLEAGRRDVPSRSLRRRRCLYVGSLTRRKNADGLMRCAVPLVRDHEVEVVIVGSTGRAFDEVAVTLPDDVRPHVRLLGQVNDPARIEREYRQAGVFLFPSHYEASPLPPVEAMRFGCPVVAADIPSLRERCGDAAAYCDPHDDAGMVARVHGLLDDDSRWGAAQEAGLLRAARYSWQRQAHTVVEQLTAAS